MRSFVSRAAVVAVAVGIAVWAASRNSRRERFAVERADPVAAPQAPEAMAAPAPVEAIEPVRSTAPEPADDHVASDGNDAGNTTVASRTGTLSNGTPTPGRIVLHDVDGRELPAGSGTLCGWLREEDGSGIATGFLDVRDSRFEVHVPADRRFVPAVLDLDGVLVHVDERAVDVDEHGELVVEAHRVPKLVLRATDALTKADLREVDVVEARTNYHPLHPTERDEERVLARRAPSPLALSAATTPLRCRWQTSLWVGAPGYVWRLIAVDFARGGSETVELEPGCTLEVAIEGAYEREAERQLSRRDEVPVLRVRKHPEASSTPDDLETEIAWIKENYEELDEAERAEAFPGSVLPDDAELRRQIEAGRQEPAAVRRRMRTIAEVRPARDTLTRFKGLPPGPVLVALEQGRDWDNPRVFGEADAELVAGTTSRVTIVVRPDDRPARVPFQGHVRVAAAWNTTSVDLQFEAIDVPGGTSADEFSLDIPTDGSPERPEWHRFDAGAILPGRWLVTSYQLQFQQLVDTGPSGRTDAEIVIGDPADAWVRLIDARTGALSELGDLVGLDWKCELPEECWGVSLEEAEWDESAQAWRLRAPAGRVELSISGRASLRYRELEDLIVTLVPGRNDLTITLTPAQALELRLEFEGAPLEEASGVAFDPIAYERNRATNTITGTRASPMYWSGGSTLWFRFPEPGRWRIELAPIPGFAPFEPFELDIPEAELVVHRVALVRQP